MAAIKLFVKFSLTLFLYFVCLNVYALIRIIKDVVMVSRDQKAAGTAWSWSMVFAPFLRLLGYGIVTFLNRSLPYFPGSETEEREYFE